LAVNLALWAALDFLHSEPHAPLALDGLFGWACYLLLGLAAGALVARAESRDAHTRALLAPALSVSPFVLPIFGLASARPAVPARPGAALIVALIYTGPLPARG